MRLVAACAALALAMVVIWYAAGHLFQVVFLEAEQAQVAGQIQRADDALEMVVRVNRDKCVGWSLWDELHDYVQKPEPGFVQSNFSAPSFRANRFDYLAVFGAQGELIHGSELDRSRSHLDDLSPTLAHLPYQTGLLSRSGDREGTSGIVECGGIPVVFAIRPIYNARGTGQSYGFVLMGARIDDQAVANIRRLTHLELSIDRLNESQGAKPDATKLNNDIGISILDDSTLYAESVIRDFRGTPFANLTIKVNRDVYRIGDHALVWMRGVILCAGVLLAVLLGALLVQGERSNQKLHVLNGELERARDAAMAATRSKSSMLATMSHELRTPMNGVMGMAEILLNSDLKPDEQECALTIQRSAKSLLHLINDILDISKVEAGRMHVERMTFNVLDLIEDTAALLAPSAYSRGIDLCTSVPREASGDFDGDPTRISQVLTNLVGNALKFTEIGHVEIKVSVVDSTGPTFVVRFEVRDTGIGIPADRQESIFQPYFQADDTTTRRFGGTGLGLTVSRQLINLMGGTIGLESAEGVGSTFWFELPLELADGSSIEVRPSVVEGVPVVLITRGPGDPRHLTRKLRILGCDVIESLNASDASKALKNLVEEGRRPVFVSEHAAHSAELESIALEIERAVPKDVPVVVITMDRRRTGSPFSKSSHAVKWLPMPVRMKALEKALQESLEKDGEQQTSSDDDTAVPPLTGLRCLLAEDNGVNLMVAERFLKQLGCSTTVAVNGQEAVAQLKSERFDFVLMDCHMPIVDGFAATRAIRQFERGNGGHVPIIALTAGVRVSDQEMCFDAGMDGFLAKPFSADELEQAVTSALNSARPAA